MRIRLTEGAGVRRGCCGGKRRRPVTRMLAKHDLFKPRTNLTYAKDEEASDDGDILGRGELSICGAEKALLGTSAAASNLLGRHIFEGKRGYFKITVEERGGK